MIHSNAVQSTNQKLLEESFPKSTASSQVIADALRNFDLLPESANVRLPIVKALFGCSSATVWRLAKQGKLKPRKLSERVTGFNVGELRQALQGK